MQIFVLENCHYLLYVYCVCVVYCELNLLCELDFEFLLSFFICFHFSLFAFVLLSYAIVIIAFDVFFTTTIDSPTATKMLAFHISFNLKTLKTAK